MASLNHQYRGKSGPTDVLSFPMYTKEELENVQPEILGDVVISVDTASRQAASAGCTLWEEITRLLIHGVLHLLGFDHERGTEDARLMQEHEQRILTALLTDDRVGEALSRS